MERTRVIALDSRTHTCYWHRPNFDGCPGCRGEGEHVRERLYIAEHFYESRAVAPLRCRIIEIQRWSGKYTLAARPRKQMAYINDVGSEGGGGGEAKKEKEL